MERDERIIILAALEHCKIFGEYLQAKSSGQGIILPATAYAEMESKNFAIPICAYADWVVKNRTPISLSGMLLPVLFYQESDIEKLTSDQNNASMVFYSLSRPGISADGLMAIIQVTAYCPSGPPNYSSMYWLQKASGKWQIADAFDFYGQEQKPLLPKHTTSFEEFGPG